MSPSTIADQRRSESLTTTAVIVTNDVTNNVVNEQSSKQTRATKSNTSPAVSKEMSQKNKSQFSTAGQ